MMKMTRSITAALVAALALTAGITHAATYYVSPSGNNSNDGTTWAAAKQTIQAAISLAVSSGDVVLVAPGTYGPISVTDNRNITIRSAHGAAVTIIDGGGTSCCATLGGIYSHKATTLEGFTLTNGQVNGGYGGGVCFGTLNDCILTGNTAQTGGGAYGSTLNRCTLTGNTADYGGGAFDCTLTRCTLSGNTATQYGGGA